MFSNSLFALPFGLIGMLLAANGLPSLRTFFWILIALVGARNAANALNRLTDYRFDADNPRTSDRHLPQGLVSKSEVFGLTLLGFSLLVLGAWQLNPLCLKLSPLAIFVLVIYSYTKRFTWAAHIVLGIACGIAPTASWLAVTGSFAVPPLILTGAVMCWVAGFDIIYATLDAEFDRQEGLYSIPACFGIQNSLLIARFLHVGVIILLSVLPLFLKPPFAALGVVYYLGVMIVMGLLIWEHSLARPDDVEKVILASYKVNQLIGITILFFAALDILLF